MPHPLAARVLARLTALAVSAVYVPVLVSCMPTDPAQRPTGSDEPASPAQAPMPTASASEPAKPWFTPLPKGGFAGVQLGELADAALQARLPVGTVRLTNGFAYHQPGTWAQPEEAFVILLDPAERVSGKLRVTLRDLGLSQERLAEAEAELAGQLTPLTAPGPLAQLLAALEELRGSATHPTARQAQQLARLTLVRMVEAMPAASAPPAILQRLAAVVEQVPPGGELQIVVPMGETRRYLIRYTSRGATPAKAG